MTAGGVSGGSGDVGDASKKHVERTKIPIYGQDPLDLYRLENIAIASCYFAVGLVMSILVTPLNVYLVRGDFR
jgi:hypothetical protein